MRVRKRRRILKYDSSSFDINLHQVVSVFKYLLQCKPQIKLFVVVVFLMVIIIWKTRHPDICGGRNILKKLCKEYHKKEISGDICYSLCDENVNDLTICINNGPHVKTFLGKDDLLIRAPVSLLNPESQLTLPVGLSLEDFIQQSSQYLSHKLGYHSKHQDLVNRFLQFADFNGNQELSLGEVQSIWRLMNNQEFLLLFMFHKQSAIPNINGTCGSLYRFQHRTHNILYREDKSGFLSTIFKHSYRWGFPSLNNRIKVAVGLLEFVTGLSETEGVQFFLCNISPVLFGHTDKFEFVVSDLSELKSSEMLTDVLTNITCDKDSDCRYTQVCQSLCDHITHKCTDSIIRPNFLFVCDIIHEYLLIGSVRHFYYDLKHYLDKCSKMHQSVYAFSAYINDFHSFLWDIIKNDKQSDLLKLK